MISLNKIFLKFVKVNSLTINKGNFKEFPNDLSISNVYVLIEENKELSSTENINIVKSDEQKVPYDRTSKVDIYGFIENNSDELIFLYNSGDYKKFQNNFEVTFPTAIYDENNKLVDTTSYINNCTFGKVYTDNYSQNRLIISGNKEILNCDWWTNDINIFMHQDDNIYKNKVNDFLYFPSSNYCYYGSSDKGIIGYDNEATGKLIVFKEKSNEDSTIYFREGIQVYKSQNEVTGLVNYDYKLNMFAGNTGLHPINKDSILNFNGSTIFVSNEKNLVGLEIKDTLQDNSRYAYSRSYLLEGKLSQYDLLYLKDHAFLYSNNYRVYLFIGQDIYCARYDEYNSSTNQYEWYPLTTHILEKDEVFTDCVSNGRNLYFSTNKGKMFINKNETINEYKDNRKIFLESGDFTENILSNEILNQTNKGDILITNYYCDISKYIEISGKVISAINKDFGRYLFSLIETGHEFYINNNDELEKIELALINNKEINVNKDLTGHKLFLKQSDDIKVKIEDFENDNILDLCIEFDNNLFKINLYNPSSEYDGYIEHYENVNAIYVSAPFSFDNLDFYKNIYQITLKNDTRKASEIYLATISNSIPLADAKYLGSNQVVLNQAKNHGNFENDTYGFSLDNFDFESMSLSQDYVAARTYTMYRNIMRQKFTCFVLYNKSHTNAIISGMSGSYEIGTPVVENE